MEFYEGLTFFLVLAIGLVPAIFLGIKEKPLKNYLFIFSIVMILLIFGEDPIQLGYLGVYILLQWSIISLFQVLRSRLGKNNQIFHLAIVWSLAPLVIAKCSGLIGNSLFSFIGLSYITFRVLQIIIETHDGVIEKSTFLETMNFLLFFPSLASGPIDRSRRYAEDLNNVPTRSEYLDMLYTGLHKILLGLVYKFILSAFMYAQLGAITGRYDPLYLVGYAYVYGLYMFFDFAGYSLMAIGTGYILGIKVPENFKLPFISKDIKEFWDRWHITLSHWLRDFLFSRFMMDAIRNKRFKSRLNAASAGFIVNMVVMGLWHGLTIDYVLYGLYHGLLLAATERFQKKKWYKAHKNKLWFKAVSWFVTLNLVMFGFLIFSGYLQVALRAVL